MKTLPEMMATIVSRHADRTAIVEDGRALTYAELEKRIASLATMLFDAGARQGDRVALLLPNGVDFVTSYFAIVTLGAIAVPLNDHYQQTELHGFLGESGASCLITSLHFAALCHQVLSACHSPCTLLVLEDQKEAGGAGSITLARPVIEVDPSAPVMYQFSSGSTGRPKRIARTHANLLCELDSLIQALHITEKDRFLGVAPFSHVNGLMRSMMVSLRAGATLYPLAKFERQAVADLIEGSRLTVCIAVPFMFGILAKASFGRRADFSSLRLCVSASAPMPARLNREFHERFGMYVRQLYGSTETGTISVNVSPDIERSLESVGIPIAGVQVEVFTEDRRIANDDETGEVAVKSPAAIKSYDAADDVNKDVFQNGYFFTGDLGRKDKNGLLYLLGRKRLFINKGGYKINPREIEELLESHPEVEEAVVIGVPTPYGDERVKAVIVSSGCCRAEEIVEYCRGKIADFKIPSLVEFRASLPKSPTGKVRKTMLQ
jgi:long-chain acyl-CoA synthetase